MNVVMPILQNQMFPEAGFDRIDEHPDMYPYFQPLFHFKDGFNMLSPENPIQVICVLQHIIEGLAFTTPSLPPLPAEPPRQMKSRQKSANHPQNASNISIPFANWELSTRRHHSVKRNRPAKPSTGLPISCSDSGIATFLATEFWLKQALATSFGHEQLPIHIQTIWEQSLNGYAVNICFGKTVVENCLFFLRESGDGGEPIQPIVPKWK